MTNHEHRKHSMECALEALLLFDPETADTAEAERVQAASSQLLRFCAEVEQEAYYARKPQRVAEMLAALDSLTSRPVAS